MSHNPLDAIRVSRLDSKQLSLYIPVELENQSKTAKATYANVSALGSISSSGAQEEFVLRNYQQRIVSKVMSTNDSAIVFLPTGGGKAVILAHIARLYANEKKHVAISVRTSILIPQLKSTLEKSGLTVGVVKAGYKLDTEYDVVLVMEQTFLSRHERLSIECDILLRDEHHIGYAGEGFKTLCEVLKPDRIVGFTATPISETGYAIDPNMPTIEEVDTQALMDMGFLSKVEYIIPRKSELIDYSKVKKSGGEYNTSSLDAILNTPEHNAFVVSEIAKHCEGRKIAVFANSIKHVEALSLALSNNGIDNVFIHSKLGIIEARTNLKRYTDGDVNIIVNMSILTTGFDDPATDAIVLVRPTKVLRLYLQIVGRGLRILQGKENCLVLDLSKCVSTHGFIEGRRRFDIVDEVGLEEEKENHQMDELCEEIFEESPTPQKVLEYRLNMKQDRIDQLVMENELMGSENQRLSLLTEQDNLLLKQKDNDVSQLKKEMSRRQKQDEDNDSNTEKHLFRIRELNQMLETGKQSVMELHRRIYRYKGEINILKNQNHPIDMKLSDDELVKELFDEYNNSDDFIKKLELANKARTIRFNTGLTEEVIKAIIMQFEHSGLSYNLKNQSCMTRLDNLMRDKKPLSYLGGFIDWINEQNAEVE